MIYNRTNCRDYFVLPSQRRMHVSSLRSFLITVVASVLIFGIVAYHATQLVTGMIFAEEEIVTTPSDTVDGTPSDSSVRGVVNLLLVCTDQYVYQLTPGGAVESQYNQIADAELRNRTTTIEFMTLVSFNSITKQVVITALPDNLLVSANGTELDLDSAYYFSQNHLHGLDPEYFVQAVSALLGIQVDYTGYVDIDEYVRVADRLSGITIASPEAIEDAGVVEGEQVFTSNMLYRMLKNDEFQDPSTKTQFLMNQCRAILERITDDVHSKTAYDDFDRIKKVLDTDFTKVALTQYKDLIFSYSRYAVQMPSVIGEFVDDNGIIYLSPDRAATQSLFRQYK